MTGINVGKLAGSSGRWPGTCRSVPSSPPRWSSSSPRWAWPAAGREKQDRSAGQVGHQAVRGHRGGPGRAGRGDDRPGPGHRQHQPGPEAVRGAGRLADHGVPRSPAPRPPTILAFSKNIAPMAQAAGIGATGVLGISSAFARLGEDGIGASTAVNKMLTDMSRSVREGGPQMKTYAEIVGKTTERVRAAVQGQPGRGADPGHRGDRQGRPGGPTDAGVDRPGGRPQQRALQTLSASGGLRPAIAQATEAYGSGRHREGGQGSLRRPERLGDRATEIATQAGEALGTPMLGPLTGFADALKVPMEMLGSVAGSGAGQGMLMGAAAYGRRPGAGAQVDAGSADHARAGPAGLDLHPAAGGGCRHRGGPQPAGVLVPVPVRCADHQRCQRRRDGHHRRQDDEHRPGDRPGHGIGRGPAPERALPVPGAGLRRRRQRGPAELQHGHRVADERGHHRPDQADPGRLQRRHRPSRAAGRSSRSPSSPVVAASARR